MKIPFVGDAYASRSVNQNAQQTINYYVEVDQTGKGPAALYGTPGTVTQHTLAAAGEVRGAFEYDGVCYWVSGTKFYSETEAGTVTEEGTLTTSTGYVSMTTNGLVVLVVDGTEGYTFTIATSAFATIADADFPPSPDRCDLLDNTFLVMEGGSQRFWISTDGTTWDASDFASAETAPDDLVSLIVDHQEILLGGKESTEVWYNSGDATFTFSRRSTIETGVAGAAAMCKADNSVFFLGNDKVVWRLNGYTPQRVSTHAIEYAIAQYSDVSDCLMWAQKEEGHVFVWLQFPTGDQTWVYDVAANMWHRRAYRNPTTGALERHRANCYVFFNEEHLVGDYENGKVYKLDLDTYEDAGDPLPAIRVCQHVTSKSSEKAERHDYLTIDLETGVGLASGQGSDPQIMLKWSNDGGHTYGNEIWRSMGATGDYKEPVRWNRLGSVRYPNSRVYWCEITDPVKRVILGADLGVG